ncbi:MAG TPA: restriction endonuclease subunit S [Bacteroidales bacterium]|nr:restriction endonuclease subunit S [Bacteroidales bacterium]
MKKYSEYKDSGILWIGRIPSHWDISSVGRNSFLGRGRVISSIEIEKYLGKFPVYSSQTEDFGILGFINTYDFEGDYVTWTTDGANAGRVFFRTGKFNCTNVCGTLQPKDKNKVNLKYLPYLLNLGTQFYVRQDINPKLMNGMMAKIPLIIPLLSEQTAIANFLDHKTRQIDDLIAKKERLIELLKEERIAIINQAVTKGLDPTVPMKDSGIEWLGEIPENWEVKKIKHIGKIINGFAFKSTEFKERGIRVVKITNIQTMHMDWSDESYIDPHYYDELPQYRIHNGDLVFALTRPIISTGIEASIFNSDEECLLNQRNALLKPSEHVTMQWLYFIIIDKLFTQDFDRAIDKTGQQPNISSIDIGELKIPIPNNKEQAETTFFLNAEITKINNLTTRYEEEISLLKEYKTSLINEAVTGKIDVRDYQINHGTN